MRGRGARGSLDLTVADERAIVQLGHRLAQLFLRVHDDGSVPSDRLFERLARNEQEANPLGTGLDDDLLATVEEDERMALRVVDRLSIWINRGLSQYCSRLGR